MFNKVTIHSIKIMLLLVEVDFFHLVNFLLVIE